MDIINDRWNNVSFDHLMTDLFYYSTEHVSTHELCILDVRRYLITFIRFSLSIKFNLDKYKKKRNFAICLIKFWATPLHFPIRISLILTESLVQFRGEILKVPRHVEFIRESYS